MYVLTCTFFTIMGVIFTTLITISQQPVNVNGVVGLVLALRHMVKGVHGAKKVENHCTKRSPSGVSIERDREM